MELENVDNQIKPGTSIKVIETFALSNGCGRKLEQVNVEAAAVGKHKHSISKMKATKMAG